MCLRVLFFGIPFFITNYFCGNKSVFAVLNSHHGTFSTISVVCLAKTVPHNGDFLSAKTLCAVKSVFLDVLFASMSNAVLAVLRYECSHKRAKKPPLRYLVIRNGIPRRYYA